MERLDTVEDIGTLTHQAAVLSRLRLCPSLTPQQREEADYLFDSVTDRLAEVAAFRWFDPDIPRG